MLSNSEIWLAMAAASANQDEIFRKFQEDHEIKKLKLQNLKLNELEGKIVELQLKSSQEVGQPSKNWFENEYRIFMWYIFMLAEVIAKHPRDFQKTHWDFIAAVFKKSATDCRYFYLCSHRSKPELWKPQEDDFIYQQMKNSKLERKWTEIGLELFNFSQEEFFRKPKTIRERWLSHLNPDIKKKDWTAEEELLLFEKVEEFGKRWSKIAKVLGNKSEHSVKNRYKKVLHQKCKANKLTEAELSQATENMLMREYQMEIQVKLSAQFSSEKSESSFPTKKITEEEAPVLPPEEVQPKYFQPIILTTSPSLFN